MTKLTNEERDVLTQMVDCWLDSDMPLTGDRSYDDAVRLLAKLGLKRQVERVRIWASHSSQETQGGKP